MFQFYGQNMEAGETAQDTGSFKSETCSAAPLATLMRMAMAHAGMLHNSWNWVHYFDA